MIPLLCINADAYEPVLGALSVNATMSESMYIVAASDSALLWKCGGAVTCLVSAVWSSFCTPYIDVARARYWFVEEKGFPHASRL